MRSFLIVFFFPVLLFAQSEFMDSSGTGLQGGINYSASNDLFGYGGEIGVSLLGIFDLGWQYAEAKAIGSSFKSSGSLFYLAFNSKRENKKDCIKLLVGYANETLTHKYYGKISASGPVLGLDFLVKVSENEVVTFMPELGILYGFLSIDTKNIYTASSDDTKSVSLALNLKVKAADRLHLIFSPTISRDLLNSSNSTTFGINAGVFINDITGNL